jgi:hypothetical protein
MTKSAIVASLVVALVTCSGAAMAQLDAISNKEAVTALKSALDKGANAAVAALGRKDGFLGNPKVRIALPESLERAESVMRRIGMGHHADELVVTMNRAAEAAVPEARKLFVDAVRRMTVEDVKGVLTGGDTAGTEYFRRSTQAALHQRFLPIVRNSTAKLGLARKYNEYAQQGAALGLVKKEHANLDEYVTQRALAGLFVMLADEERKIRKNPAAAGSRIIRKVFGALR